MRLLQRICVLALIAGISTVALYATGQIEDTVLETGEIPVTLVLDWVPNTNHTGLYVALDRSFYADEGLRVEIVQPSEVGAEALVANGVGQFGISHQEAVTYARTADSPLPIVAVAAILQHNTSGFLITADRGVQNPGDLEHLRYGGWGSEYEEALISAVMTGYDADPSTVEIGNVGTMDIFAAFDRLIDFAWVFYGWDGVRAEIEGTAVTYLPLSEFDSLLDYYTPVIVTAESYAEENPEVVSAFLRATERGYRAVIQDPEGSADTLLQYAPEIGREHAVASISYLTAFFLDQGEPWGLMDDEPWESFATFMDDAGLLPRPLDFRSAYTNAYLSE